MAARTRLATADPATVRRVASLFRAGLERQGQTKDSTVPNRERAA